VLVFEQLAEGTWTDADGRPDLHATYQVARTLHAFAIETDRRALNSFIARCRRDDGSYASAPDVDDGDLIDSYLALTVDRWTNDPYAPGIN
jgi:hypothetical protein